VPFGSGSREPVVRVTSTKDLLHGHVKEATVITKRVERDHQTTSAGAGRLSDRPGPHRLDDDTAIGLPGTR